MKQGKRIAAFLGALVWVWLCLSLSLQSVKAVGPSIVTVYPGNDEPYEIEVGPGQQLYERELAVPEPQSGAEFVGWYTEDGKPYDFSRVVTQNMILWAKWRWDSVYIHVPAPQGPLSGHDVYADDYRDQAYSATEYVNVVSSYWLTESGDTFTYFEPGKTYQVIVELETERSPGGGLHFAFDEDTSVYFNSFYEATQIDETMYNATYAMRFTMEEENEIIDSIAVAIGIVEDGESPVSIEVLTDHVWLQDFILKDQNGNLFPGSLQSGQTYQVSLWLTPLDEGYIFGPDTQVMINGKACEPDEVPGERELWVTWQFKYEMRYGVTLYPYPNQPGSRVIIVLEGEALGEVELEPLEGYEFVGWFTDPAFTNPYDVNKPVTGDLVLYGNWVPVQGEQSGEDSKEESSESSKPESSESSESSSETSTKPEGGSEESSSSGGESGTSGDRPLRGRRALLAVSGVAAGGLLAVDAVVLIRVLRFRKHKRRP